MDSDPETKMHVFADHIVIDLLFTAPLNPPALSRLALQLVVRKEYLQRLLVIYSYTVGQMYRLVYKLRALLLRVWSFPFLFTCVLISLSLSLSLILYSQTEENYPILYFFSQLCLKPSHHNSKPYFIPLYHRKHSLPPSFVINNNTTTLTTFSHGTSSPLFSSFSFNSTSHFILV